MNTNTRSRSKALTISSLLFFIVLIQLVIRPVAAQESTQTDGQCNPLDVVLLIDQSASIGGGSGIPASDPDNFRIAAVHAVIDQLGDNILYLCPDLIHRIGVISFGNSSQIDLPFIEIDPDFDNIETWQSIRENLKNAITPQNLELTDFAEAFTTAKQMFDGLGPLGAVSRKRAIILLADGGPCVPELGCIGGNYTFDAGLYLEELREQIKYDFPFFSSEKGYYLWIVAMRDFKFENNKNKYNLNIYFSRVDQTLEQYWADIAQTNGGKLVKLSQNEQEIPTTFFDIITKLAAKSEVKLQQCTTLNIEPYTERITILFFKNNSNIRVKIDLSSNDSLITLENGYTTVPSAVQISEYSKEGATERYVIYKPSPGVWSISSDNCQAMNIRQEAVMPKMTLVEPIVPLFLYDIKPFYDPNSPHYLIYEMREKGSAQLFPENEQYPIRFTLKITSPSGQTSTQTLSYTSEGTYRGSEPLPVGELGEYQVVLTGETDSPDPASTEPYQVFSEERANYTVRTEVRNFDFEILDPQPDTNQALDRLDSDDILSLEVTLRLVNEDGQPLDPTWVFTGPPDSWFGVALANPDGSTSIARVMTDEADANNLIARFDTAAKEGAYKLQVDLIGAYREDRFLPIRLKESISFNRYATTHIDMDALEPRKNYSAHTKFLQSQIDTIPVEVFEPSPNAVLPVHESGIGCLLGRQHYPSVDIQLTKSQPDFLNENGLVPVIFLTGPDGTAKKIEFKLMESLDGLRLVGKAESIPALAGEYRFEILFEEGARLVELYPFHNVTLSRNDSLFTNPTVCRGVVGLTGTIIMSLLIFTGGFFLSLPIGTLVLVQAGVSDKLAGPWVLHRYRRLQKIRSKQLEKLGIQEIILSKANPINLNEAKVIKVKAKDLGGKWFVTDQILHPSDDPQPFVDGIDIRYE